MTREEAIKYLGEWKWSIIDRGDTLNSDAVQSLTMAIEALTSQNLTKPNNTCEVDLISRADAIRWVKTECNPYGKPTLEFESGKRVIEHLKQMPSAEAVQGEWEDREVFNETDDDHIVEEWQSARCSVCGKYHTTPYMYYFDDFNFCPNCGARMKGGAK